MEARALSQGRLQCLGSTSHLKLRFGGGYLLEVQAPDDKALQARLGAFIVRELGGQADEERHLGHTKYLLPAKHQVGWSANSPVLYRLQHSHRSVGLVVIHAKVFFWTPNRWKAKLWLAAPCCPSSAFLAQHRHPCTRSLQDPGALCQNADHWALVQPGLLRC